MKMTLLSKTELLRGPKICDDCKQFVKKHKSWNEKKVPSVCLIKSYKCSEDKLVFETYKNMVCIWKKV